VNADSWARAKPILAEAAELPAAQPEAFVAARCEDLELRREILDLLPSPAAVTAAS
jgi:hypothetical protein